MGAGARSGTWPGARGRSPRRSGGSPGPGRATSLSTARRSHGAGGRCGSWGWRCPATSVPEGTQLALPLEPHEGPELRALSAWERMLADYGSTGVTLREHPLELMRPSLPGDLRTSEELERHQDGRRVRVAGLVVARQRPATAKGVTFMLLEDEHGTINLIVPPPVLRALPAGGARRAAGAGRRPPRAPRGHDERAWWTGSSASSAPTCRAPRSSTSSRAGRGAPRPRRRPTCGRWCRRPTASGGAAERPGARVLSPSRLLVRGPNDGPRRRRRNVATRATAALVDQDGPSRGALGDDEGTAGRICPSSLYKRGGPASLVERVATAAITGRVSLRARTVIARETGPGARAMRYAFGP